MKNLLITGYPRVGKTTLIKRIVETTSLQCTGFYTEEMKSKSGIREGFKIITITTGEEAILAHIGVQSERKVGKYNVMLEPFEKLALVEMTKQTELLVIDEIGKMELYSEKFKKKLLECLMKKNVLATITMKGGGTFVDKIKARTDVDLFELTINTREDVYSKLMTIIEQRRVQDD